MARHAPERNKMIEERTKYGRFKGNLSGSGITNEVAAQRIEALRERLSSSQLAWSVLQAKPGAGME